MLRTLASQNRIHWSVEIGAAALLIGCGLASVAEAQPQQPRAFSASLTREQRDQFADDLNGTANDFGQDFRRGNERPRERLPNGQVTAELQKLRPLLADATAGISQLVAELHEDAVRRPAARALLVDAMKLQGNVSRVSTRAQRTSDHQDLVDDLRDIDAEWRELSYQMKVSRDISRQSDEQVGALQDIAEQIGAVMLIQPQVNLRDLLQRTAALSANIRALGDDLQADVGSSADARRLLLNNSRAEQQVRAITNLAQDSAGRDEIIQAYQRFQDLWYPHASRLQSVNSRAVSTGLRRITQTDNEIHQLLTLPQKAEKGQLLYLASVLKRDIDTFFDRTPLNLLIHLPQNRKVISVSDQFYGVCDNFVDIVNREEKTDAIVDAFGYIEGAAKEFSDVFSPIESDAALAVLRQIEQSIATIRTSLNLQQQDYSNRAAVELVAEIDNMATNLEFVVKRWLSNDRVSFSAECQREVTGFADLAVRLHEDLTQSQLSAAQARSEIENLYSSWRRVYALIVRCQSAERRQLGQIASRMTPSLVELRTMLGQ